MPDLVTTIRLPEHLSNLLGAAGTRSESLRSILQAVADNQTELQRRAGDASDVSGPLADALQRYFYLLRRAYQDVREVLTASEITLVCAACPDVLFEAWSIAYMVTEVEDAMRLYGLAEKHGVDGPALMAKLRGLTPIQVLALADAVEYFRHAHDDTARADTTAPGDAP